MKSINKIFNNIIKSNYSELTGSVLGEPELEKLSKEFIFPDSLSIVESLVIEIPKQNRNYDWNIGSLLQHFSPKIIANILDKIDNSIDLTNSIGVAWCLGEYNNLHPVIIEHLYKTVRYSKDSSARWRAAFSLEQLQVEEAINLLKRTLKTKHLQHITYYLENLNHTESVVAILVLSTVDNTKKMIYPRLKAALFGSDIKEVIINSTYLIGRLRLFDDEIIDRLVVLSQSENYEIKHSVLHALANNTNEKLRVTFEKMLSDKNPLVRKMAANGLGNMAGDNSNYALQKALFAENNNRVISAITRAIYKLTSPYKRKQSELLLSTTKNENGLIGDDSDKWYGDPSIYHKFSVAEDPENLCIKLIVNYLKNIKIINPIDLATGTGRIAWQIAEKMNYSGTLYAVDASRQMVNFITKNIAREHLYTRKIKIIESTIADVSDAIPEKSNFIISSFGFPSKTSDPKIALSELKEVKKMLTKDGLFLTIGWDETFNDSLNMMWYRYVPDKFIATSFEEWRNKRMSEITSPRNCGLTWWKKGLRLPLQFDSVETAAEIMGALFGRDAATYIVSNGLMSWDMSIGITIDDRSSIDNAIKMLEKR